MNKLLNILLPRFITEEVALRDAGDHLVPACSMEDLRPGERFAAVATIRSFNLFGLAIFPRMIGQAREWPTETPADEAEAKQPAVAPCPFCLMPAVAVVLREDPNPEETCSAPRLSSYGCGGLEVVAKVFCHECGAHGPEHYDVIFDAQDYDAAAAEAIKGWEQRQETLAILKKVEQMAAYYEAPKGFFDWLDLVLANYGATPATGSPAGLSIQTQESKA